VSIRASLCSALFLCLALAAPKPASAMSIVEPLAFSSWRPDPNTLSLGGGAAVGVLSFDIVPTFEYVYETGATDWAFNVDGHLPVLALPVVALYIGAGYATYSHDPDHGDSSKDAGVNLLFGAKASLGRLKPFGEIKYTTAGPDGYVLTLGTRFHLFD
jgi:hypothetical protein